MVRGERCEQEACQVNWRARRQVCGRTRQLQTLRDSPSGSEIPSSSARAWLCVLATQAVCLWPFLYLLPRWTAVAWRRCSNTDSYAEGPMLTCALLFPSKCSVSTPVASKGLKRHPNIHFHEVSCSSVFCREEASWPSYNFYFSLNQSCPAFD